MTSTLRRLFLALVVAASAATAGCATVQPWQRGVLADECMIFDANGSLVSFASHWQESREGAMGGFGVQGGGCGCK